MIFGQSTNLWFLLIVIGLVVLEFILWSKKKKFMAELFPGELNEFMLKNWNKRNHWIKNALFVMAILFLIIALARPQWGQKTQIASRMGIDIMIAIDVSKSMLTQDLKPNRLENAKNYLNMILEELAGNRIGLVAFAGQGFVSCPLTTDVEAVKIFLRSIDTSLIPDPGTNIESAIDACIKAFGRSTDSKVIILLTDGEELSGSALKAADQAQAKGIKIFAVGIGSLEGAPIPTEDGGFKKDEKENIIMSRVNPDLLNALTEKTGGGTFLISQDSTGFQKLFAAIALLPKQKISQSMAWQYQERFQIFIFLSFLCLVAEMMISERKSC